MGMLDGKIALVTGASRGIGKSIAQLFAKEGALVYAISRNQEDILVWSKNVSDYSMIRAISLDITDENAVKKCVMDIRKESGRLDILVNNAGVEYNELIGMISKKHMENMFATNVYAVIELIQYVSRIMKNGGSIINISSTVGLRGNKGQLVYSATKGAVIALTKSAAKELAEKKIRVNSIAPGLTKTDMMDAADIEKLSDRINNIYMKRLATPEDIAKSCLYLASDLAEYVSGQILEVDGCTIM